MLLIAKITWKMNDNERGKALIENGLWQNIQINANKRKKTIIRL